MSYLKKCIAEVVKKHDFAYALIKVVRNRKNTDAMRMITNPICYTRTRPGQHSLGKAAVFYYDCNTVCGLFWYLRRVLEVLYYCDRMGFVPQIRWSSSLYYDESVTNTKNVFEYYYQQPFSLSDKDLKMRPIVDYAPNDEALARGLIGDEKSVYEGDTAYIDALADIAETALQYKPEVKAEIDGFVQRHRINSNTLGIHIRGTDFRRNFEGHPVFVEPKDFFVYVDSAIKDCGFQKIYLATDDQNILDEFLAHYPSMDIIFSEDVQRGRGDTGIHANTYANEDQSPYREGLDALCDMSALASCGGLISGVSNLPLIARIISKSEKNIYRYDKVINKGLNARGENASSITFSSLKQKP